MRRENTLGEKLARAAYTQAQSWLEKGIPEKAWEDLEEEEREYCRQAVEGVMNALEERDYEISIRNRPSMVIIEPDWD